LWLGYQSVITATLGSVVSHNAIILATKILRIGNTIENIVHDKSMLFV